MEYYYMTEVYNYPIKCTPTPTLYLYMYAAIIIQMVKSAIYPLLDPENMRTHQSSLVFFTLVLFYFLNGSVFCAAPPTVQEQCSSEFSKVGVCLSFATGKADSPTKECCSTVEDIKDKNPVCLCFVIQQAHDGSSSLKSMGLQEAKLLQLPSACKLANANITECPKLLNLSPSSPDIAIFKDPSNSPPVAPAATSTPSTTKDSSMGFIHKPFMAFPIAITLATTMFICVLNGVSSSFSL